jgi:hypothetical protein
MLATMGIADIDPNQSSSIYEQARRIKGRAAYLTAFLRLRLASTLKNSTAAENTMAK